MISTIGDGVTAVIGWIGNVIGAIFGTVAQGTTDGTWAALLPIIGVAVGIGIVGFAIRTIKNVVWGYN